MAKGKIVFGNMPQFLCLTSNFLNKGMKLLKRGKHQMYYFPKNDCFTLQFVLIFFGVIKHQQSRIERAYVWKVFLINTVYHKNFYYETSERIALFGCTTKKFDKTTATFHWKTGKKSTKYLVNA